MYKSGNYIKESQRDLSKKSLPETSSFLRSSDDLQLFGWAKRLDGLVLFMFVSGTVFLTGFGQQRALGVLLCFVFFLNYMLNSSANSRLIFPVPPELKLYTAWVVWAGITGYLVAVSFDAFWSGYRVVLQMLVLVWVLYGTLRVARNSVNAVFLAIIFGVLVQLRSVFSDFDNLRNQLSAERVLGETANPNSLGLLMIYGALCALMFWWVSGRRQMIVRSGILLLFPFLSYVIVASGSRKSALVFVFLLIGWGLFAVPMGKGAKALFVRIIVGGLLLAGLFVLVPYVLENTHLGYRFLDFFEAGGSSVEGSLEANIRYWMYVEAWRIFLEHPIFGVGINNFGQYFWTGQYTHSNYMEPLVTTGLIGFLLFHSFYVCVVWRAIKLLRYVEDKIVQYRLKLMIVGILTIMLIGIGTPHYTSNPIYILLTAISVYTWRISNEYKQNNKTIFESSGGPS